MGLLGNIFSGILGIGQTYGSVLAQQDTNRVNQQIAADNLAYQREANEANLAYQREANAQNIALQREAWAREDNATQRRVSDLTAAGLSPVLAAGSAASSSSPVKIESLHQNPIVNERKFSSPVVNFLPIMQALQMSQQFATQQSQIDYYKALSNKANNEAAVINSTAHLKVDKLQSDIDKMRIAIDIMSQYGEDTAQAKYDLIQAQKALSEAKKSLTDAQADKTEKEADMVKPIGYSKVVKNYGDVLKNVWSIFSGAISPTSFLRNFNK